MTRLANFTILFFQNKIRRTYCKWALAKKRKSLNALTPFEKKFLMVLKRVCLLGDTEFDYGYRNDVGRIVYNNRLNVTIQVKGNEIKFFDSEMITIFFSTQELSDYIVSIIDRSTERRALKKAESISEMQLTHLKKIEGELFVKNRLDSDSPKKKHRIVGET